MKLLFRVFTKIAQVAELNKRSLHKADLCLWRWGSLLPYAMRSVAMSMLLVGVTYIPTQRGSDFPWMSVANAAASLTVTSSAENGSPVDSNSSELRLGERALHGAKQTVSPQPSPSVVTPLEGAWQAYQSGEYNLARERYEQVIGGNSNVDVQLGLAAIAIQQHHREYAVQYYQQALLLDPRNATALAALATLGEARYAAETEEKIRQLLGQQSSAILQFSIGNLYAGQQRWREAELAYFESFRGDSRNADYAYNLAVSLDYLRQYQAAVTYYMKARDLAQSGGAHIDISQLNARINQLQSALGQSK